MSASLIAAQVRKAGHKLRIEVDETPGKESAICTIIRRDDPDHPFVSKRDRAWAQRMGLLNNSNYIKQPATMLKKRAITDCARDACSEALCGIDYTPDEMSDLDDVEARVEETEKTVEPTQNAEIVEAEIVDEAKPQQSKATAWQLYQQGQQSKSPLAPLATREQHDEILKLLHDAGFLSRVLAADWIKKHLLPTPTSVMTYADAQAILDNPQALMNQARKWLREQSTKRTQEASQQQGEQK